MFNVSSYVRSTEVDAECHTFKAIARQPVNIVALPALSAVSGCTFQSPALGSLVLPAQHTHNLDRCFSPPPRYHYNEQRTAAAAAAAAAEDIDQRLRFLETVY
jgi:hypothetical protein